MPLLSIMFIVSYFQNCHCSLIIAQVRNIHSLQTQVYFLNEKWSAGYPFSSLPGAQGSTYVAVFPRDSQDFPVRHVFLVVGLYSKTVFIWSFKTMTLKQTGKIPTNSK